jgi:hypothetical protein
MLKQQQTKREDFANLSDINEKSLAQYADGFIASNSKFRTSLSHFSDLLKY